MNSKNEERYLSQKIDYDRDIEPYQFIMIHAGVGSGKNRFIDNLVRGGVIEHKDGQHEEKFVTPKTVLLITSRRAKVNEQLSSKVAKYDKEKIYDSFIPWWMDEREGMEIISSPKLKLPDLGGLVTNEIFMRSHVQTNAKVEFAQRDEYCPDQSITQPWFCYDLIVVDEVHSVVADASYQTAPFYVRRLIERVLEINPKCKVITMTGTPQVLEGIPLFEKAHLIDMMEECINVKPAKITFLMAFEARQKQLEMMKRGEKFVAFFNHISVLMGLHREMPDCAVMSFSDETERKKLEKDDRKSYDRMLAVEKYLAEENKLPDDVGAFLTTARNKEGIEEISLERIRIILDAIIEKAGVLRSDEYRSIMRVRSDSFAQHMVFDLAEKIPAEKRAEYFADWFGKADADALVSLAAILNMLELGYGRVGSGEERTEYAHLVALEELLDLEKRFCTRAKWLLEQLGLFDLKEWRIVCHLLEHFDPEYIDEYLKSALKDERNIVRYLRETVATWTGTEISYEVIPNYTKYMTAKQVNDAILLLRDSGELFDFQEEIQNISAAFYLDSIDKKNYRDRITQEDVDKLLEEWRGQRESKA